MSVASKSISLTLKQKCEVIQKLDRCVQSA